MIHCVPAHRLRLASALLALLLWIGCAPGTALSQTITVENGGEIEMRNGGTWDLEGTTVDLGDVGAAARIDETGGGRFTGGLLQAIRDLSAPSQADPAGLGAEISSGEDLGSTAITRGHTVQTGGGNASISRYFDVSPTNNDALDATLTFSYAEGELNGLSEDKLVFFRSTDGGANWSQRGMDGRSTSGNRVTLNGIDTFSRWTLASEDLPLPVELADFEAQVEGSDAVRVTWQTASEQNNSGFRVQRSSGRASASDATWTTLGTVDGAGTTTEPQTYRFNDTDLPYAADSLHYRLKQVDLDGTTHVSDPITVDRGAVATLQLHAPYPNPVSDRVTVRYAVPPKQSEAALRVYDVLGRAVRTVNATPQEGRQETQIDVSGLSSGLYVLRLHTGETAKTKRFTVVQ